MSYKELMQFIGNNKEIPKRLETLSPDTQSVKDLQDAINTGNFDAKVWKEKQCNLDLVYLFKEGKITPEVFATSYFYLLFKMPLRDEHAELAFNQPVEIKKLSENNCLTDDGKKYLTQLYKDLSEIGIKFSFNDLEKFVLSLPPTEQWLVKTQYPTNNFQSSTSRMLRALGKNTPLFQYSQKEDFIFFNIPPYSVIKFVLDHMSYPIELMLCFGTVGLETLHKLHEKGRQPVSIYAPQVKSNLREQMDTKIYPLLLLQHMIFRMACGAVGSIENIFLRYYLL